MATHFRCTATAELLDDGNLLSDNGRVLGNLFTVRSENNTPSAPVDKLLTHASFKRSYAPADRCVLDADPFCRAQECAGLGKCKEMPQVIPVEMCEFLPSHCSRIGNFLTFFYGVV